MLGLPQGRNYTNGDNKCMHTYKHSIEQQQLFYGFCPGLLGWANTKRNIRPLTSILIINLSLSASSIYYDP